MPNRLASQTSPYLQQHAGNPVNWHPWDGEALALARREDKPILLSVGYSACHWCHVMAHESFEDPEVAAQMNRYFVNIKVDREERPDLDQIYQTAHAMLTQRSGGWPLTMFLTPDGTPFFGGTYFPKHARYGMPGFLDLLPRIAEIYQEKRDEIGRQNTALLEALARTVPAPAPGHELKRAPIDAAVRELAQIFDEVHGGLGQAPKFPHPFELAFCLRRHVLDRNETAIAVARLTLTRMAEGGIYDQIGGGFCRYSVDQHWAIPHFEKMLYDNAALLGVYSDAWQITGHPLYREVVAETARWVMREMQSPEGGYYSSIDADSEHEEGKFYVWTPGEVRALLSGNEYAAIELHYGFDRPPNFEGKAWHPCVAKPVADVAQALGITADECAARIAAGRAKLFAARSRRVPPGRDEKILTSWNALMIRGMARAARVFGEPAWLASARGALEFIRGELWRDGRLMATYKDRRAHLNAYLDDYAFLLDALLELLQEEFRTSDLALAGELADVLLDQFEDREAGGFFFVSHDHEVLIHRPKQGHDGATPSGNGVAAHALQRLGHLTGETRYLEAARRTLELFYPLLERQPSACATLATALEEHLVAPQVAILRGAPDAIAEWRRLLSQRCRPASLILGIGTHAGVLPATLDKPAHDSAVSAWVCRGSTCLAPITNREELERVLTEG